ncbi:MAG: glycosyltransferase family 8 protein [Jatrophihabitantaceae bacterium]
MAVPEGEIPFAVLDCQLPGRPLASPNEGDAFNTAAALGNLARRRGVRFTGDEGVVALAENLRSRVDPRRAIDGEDATVRLYRVDRDASDCSAVPDGTWLLASGPFVHTPNDLHRNLPLNRRVRPIFIGFHTEPRVLHDGGVIAYLQRHAPIGCRDWRTVYLLQAAGIPAFFSGWITTTLDTVSGAGGGTVPGAFGRDHLAALDRTLALANGPQPVRTKEMRVYLAGRALGAQVDFRPEHAGDVALDGLIGISDPEFERLRSTVLDLLSTVLAAVVAGKGEDEVYAAWREACTPFVAEAQARSAQPLPELPPPSFDVAAAVRQTLAARVVVERSQPAPDGAEINVELSLDGNYKHQLDVVLDSIVVNASRPIRAFVLARDHTRNDFDRMARLFPTVSFVWLPTDDADYGPISGMLRHITVATMDRLLLPDLLPDIDKIIHHDLDALCLADLAELFDIELGNSPIAARDQRHPFQGSGYVSMVNGVAMLDTIERSRELMLRLTRRHPFDYRTFNAGIMVLNLTQMRADGFTRNYLPLIERFGFHDQGLLNLYAGSQHHEFERGWNVYPRFELCEDAKILHWLGPWKPWRGAFIDGQPLWREAEARVVERERAAGLR